MPHRGVQEPLGASENTMSHRRKQEDQHRAQNLVAKHAHKFNTSRTFTDRKRAVKVGKVKHKGQLEGLE